MADERPVLSVELSDSIHGGRRHLDFPVAGIGQSEECLPQPCLSFLMLQGILRACGGQLQNKKLCKSHRAFMSLPLSYVMRPMPILMCCIVAAHTCVQYRAPTIPVL